MSSNEMIYTPTITTKDNEYRGIRKYRIFDTDIVLINYNIVQIKPKKVDKVIRISKKIKGEKIIRMLSKENIEWPSPWLTDNKENRKNINYFN